MTNGEPSFNDSKLEAEILASGGSIQEFILLNNYENDVISFNDNSTYKVKGLLNKLTAKIQKSVKERLLSGINNFKNEIDTYLCGSFNSSEIKLTYIDEKLCYLLKAEGNTGWKKGILKIESKLLVKLASPNGQHEIKSCEINLSFRFLEKTNDHV